MKDAKKKNKAQTKEYDIVEEQDMVNSNIMSAGYTAKEEYKKDSLYVKRWKEQGRCEEAFAILASCKFSGMKYEKMRDMLMSVGLIYDDEKLHRQTLNTILRVYGDEIYQHRPVSMDLASNIISQQIVARAMAGDSNSLKQYIGLNANVLSYIMGGNLGKQLKEAEQQDKVKENVIDYSEETKKTVNNLYKQLKDGD